MAISLPGDPEGRLGAALFARAMELAPDSPARLLCVA